LLIDPGVSWILITLNPDELVSPPRELPAVNVFRMITPFYGNAPEPTGIFMAFTTTRSVVEIRPDLGERSTFQAENSVYAALYLGSFMLLQC